MAAAILVRNALQLIGFSAAASQAISDQGHDSFDELALLTDDEVDGLCKSLRAPGGTIPGPPAAAGGVAGPAIPNPGVPVPTRAQNNLKLLCYYFRFSKRCSQAIAVPQITLANIRNLRGQREQEEAHTDPTAPEIEGDDWPKIIDTLLEYFGACLGVTKLPLAYVLRESLDPTPRPADGWSSNEAQMIARGPIVTNPGAAGAPIYTTDFQADNKTVWLLLASICREHSCWAYLRQHQRKQNGRAAFQALVSHYLGSNNVNTMSARAMNKLINTTYNGERRRWNWESFVRVHVEQHAILEDLKIHGHCGIDEGSKVRFLMAGVRTTELDTVKASILGNLALLTDFTAASSLYKAFIDANNANRPRDRDITIAALKPSDDTSVSSADGGNSEHYLSKVKPDMSVEERYYNRAEYRKLTDAQKAGLLAKRTARGRKSKSSKKNKRGTPRKQEITLSNKTIAKFATALKGNTLGPDPDDNESATSESTEEEEEVAMKSPGKKQKIIKNRTNPALQRNRNN